MRIRIDDIQEKAGAHKRVPVMVTLDPVEMAGQIFHFDQPLAGEGEIWNTGESLLLRANLSGEAITPCSRCLTPFRLRSGVVFEEEFVRGAAPSSAEEEGGERPITYYQGDEIDLTDSLRDHVLLELPMKPLCNEECRGLCPICGSNRNEIQCACKASEDIDPRLAAFQALIQKPEPSS